ncbi:PP2C family protein-serine/threonine phosphatase [Dactylosporangium sp. NPDC000521]|uniref:PP2C family protein-serine/threonine phosphatase n=1 Tax=Dactylosporangium sp. NPDC000521 TaxID=3363975 RepID=UPI003682CD3F
MRALRQRPDETRAAGSPMVLSDLARLAALAASGLIGTGPERVFDDLTGLAASVTGCAISAITLVGETRTYWKSVPHLPYGGVEAWQNAVGDSFCYFAVTGNGPFVVQDAEADPRSLLPPLLRPVPGLDAAARYLPVAGEIDVIGDFYDLFQDRGRWWTAVMEDVAGKGTEAAKVTALARYTLRADAVEHLSPAVVLGRLTSAMLAQRAARYLTAVQVTFRATAGGLTGRLCLAGHPPALIRRADGRVQQVGVSGTLLGVFDDVYLVDVRFRLSPGDLMLHYTDGACEARPDPDGPAPDRPMFDEAALARTLAASRDLDAAATVQHIATTLDAHHGGWTSDDTALLALRVPPPGRTAPPAAVAPAAREAS